VRGISVRPVLRSGWRALSTLYWICINAGVCIWRVDGNDLVYLPRLHTDTTTTTGRPCFSMTTGAARAVSINRPKLYFASRAERVFMAMAYFWGIIVAIMAVSSMLEFYLRTGRCNDFRRTLRSIPPSCPLGSGEVGAGARSRLGDCEEP
jgi:hypothetical protein